MVPHLEVINVCTNFMAIHHVDAEIPHRISDKFDLLVVPERKSGLRQS